MSRKIATEVRAMVALATSVALAAGAIRKANTSRLPTASNDVTMAIVSSASSSAWASRGRRPRSCAWVSPNVLTRNDR